MGGSRVSGCLDGGGPSPVCPPGAAGRPLTHQRDPHAERRPIHAEVFQDVVPHEAEDRQARPVAGVVQLRENPQVVSGKRAVREPQAQGWSPNHARREPGHSLAVRPWAKSLTGPIYKMGHCLPLPSEAVAGGWVSL